MSQWVKKPVKKSETAPLCSKYGIEPLLASIFVRRGITSGSDLLYFLENDLRFQHEPFCFNGMEDAVERILSAKEEGEKLLIFGDSDVDGVTSTAILYNYLSANGWDVSWRVPLDSDPYGLSIKAVDDFYAQQGTLIITVDCGISNIAEVQHANELGIDVIVTDHHNAPEILPDAIVIIDPKTKDSGYPFNGISGAAVAYKLVSALRFASSNFYNSDICFLNIQQDENTNHYHIDCLKTRNLTKIKELHETIIPGRISIYETKLINFLQGQVIYVWDSRETKQTLSELFGNGIEFSLVDFRSEAAKLIPSLGNQSSSALAKLSTSAKYSENENSIIESIYNLYITYCKKVIKNQNKDLENEDKKDIQLVALAALADIMPMKDENRIFVKAGIDSIKKLRPVQGLAELFARMNINPDSLTSVDLSWNIIPALNAAGRLGQSDVAVKLLISKEAKERDALAQKIVSLNEERKQKVLDAIYKVHDKAVQSVADYQNKLCVVVDENIHPGLTGLIASRLMSDTKVPAIAITYENDICIGSVRSCRNFIATEFLDSFKDFFINHGGHNYAAGFSFEKNKLESFIAGIKERLPGIEIGEESEAVEIDAEIPPDYVTAEVFKLIDIFEPCGNESPELTLNTNGLTICDAAIVGKKEPFHLKLTLDSGKCKIPAMFWGQGELFHQGLTGKKCDILYKLSRNYFNGITTNQFIISDMKLN